MRRWILALPIIAAMAGCDQNRHHAVSGEIISVDPPTYQKYVPPILGFMPIVMPDPNGAPQLGLWDDGLTQLVGLRAAILCPSPPNTGVIARRHPVRFVMTGSWPLQFTPGDTLRGLLTRSEDIEFGSYNPTPIPDSLGSFVGGRFALGVDGDSLKGYAVLQYSGACSCEQPVPIFLIKESQ